VSSVKRRYDSTRRQAQAADTRRAVLDAAGDLFATRGYAATSIDAIAAQAGVSRETIFKTFGTKRRLLQLWVERQVAGGNEAVPIAQQQWVQLIRETPDGDRQVEIAAAALSEIYDRAIDAIVALRAAAHVDPDIAELWQLSCDQRRDDVTTVTALFAGSDEPPPDRSKTEVVDVAYALTSPEMFELLVRQCGWTPEQFQRWLADVLARLVLHPATRTSEVPVSHIGQVAGLKRRRAVPPS
jgi:TetR/AcrR family transcriptional regulator of autoinduction and epiphytic fitness